MPFARPTLDELIDRVATDIASRLPGTNFALLRRSLAGALARAEAGAVHSLYGYLDFIAKQAIPDTAEDEYLLRWVAIWLPDGRKPATYATGVNAVQVTGAIGTPVPEGTMFVRRDGQQYRSTADVFLAGTTGLISVIAVSATSKANTTAGVELSLFQPVPGLSSGALVVSPGITGGNDQESITALRARLIRRIQQPPQGGSEADYETWALEVPGITRAWVKPMYLGPGTVAVFVASDTSGTAPIPDAGTVAAAQAYIEERAPVTAIVYVMAPTAFTVNIVAKLSPNTIATQAAARAELADLFLREAEPGGTIPISKIREAISIASGVNDSQVTSPAVDVVAGAGAIPILGTTTWSAL
jgi:uncharacterized phage protein gp47/JayE